MTYNVFGGTLNLTQHNNATAHCISAGRLGLQGAEWLVFAVPGRRLLLPPTANDFDCPTSPRARFQELTQLFWVIDHSPLLDRVYLSTDVILN